MDDDLIRRIAKLADGNIGAGVALRNTLAKAETVEEQHTFLDRAEEIGFRGVTAYQAHKRFGAGTCFVAVWAKDKELLDG